MRIELTFLGTGTSQGIPVIGSTHPVCLSDDPRDKRLRVSVHFKVKDQSIVVDCGPDFRQQMLTNGISKLDALLFTHEHADHTAGLDDLRPFFFKQGKLQTFMTERVHEALKERFNYIFTTGKKYPGVPDLDVELFDHDKFNVDDVEITPIEADHGFLPVYGFRIGDVAYMTDVKTIPDPEKEKLKDLDVLIINMLREEPHKSHLNLEEAIELIDELKPKRTYFTHISHHLGFHAEVQEKLPENVYLAYDNLKIISNS
jgi:phosphoribosyl 1,2-cyclic phosphate phosphodiesterase